MPWYLFALATPAFYTFSNFIDKYLLEKKFREPVTITAVTCIISGLIGLLAGLVFGFADLGFTQISMIVAAGLLLTFYTLPYYEAMKLDDASRVVPLFQFIPVFTLIMSAVFLKETLLPRQIAGLLVVVLSGVAISAEKLEGRMFRPRKSLWYMLLSSLMYGSVGIIFRLAVREASFWAILPYEYLGTGLGGLLLFLLPVTRRNIKRDVVVMRSSAGIILVNNVIAIAAQLSETYAISLVAVPLVNLLGSVQPLFSLGLGFLLTKKLPGLIKEDISRTMITRKLASIGLIFVGLYLVYF